MTLDPDSPVPLYHQLAEAIAYRIAVGRLRPGDRLPSMREAGEELEIHYLTVRKAYGALEARGLVERVQGVGTRVLERARGATGAPPVHAFECNEPQADDYAAQLAAALGTPIGTILLDDPGEPPPGLLVGTYFHFNDARERWPARGGDLRFVAARPDADLGERVPAPAPGGPPVRVRLCETRSGRAHNVTPDLAEIFPPDRFTLESVVVRDPGAPLHAPDPSPVLYSPRLWVRLADAEREDPRAVLLRYRLDPADVETLRAEVATEEARAS